MKTVKIFVHDPQIELDCAHATATALKTKFKVQMLTVDTLADGLHDADILAVGGGIGDADTFFSIMSKKNKAAVQKFVHWGGKYLGICMGAYWADKRYFDVTNMDVRQYCTSRGADITHEEPAVASVVWRGEKHQMYFYDGCTFYNTGDADIVATYKNNRPMAVLDHSVALIGCHPESEDWWFSAYNKRHGELLCELAQELAK